MSKLKEQQLFYRDPKSLFAVLLLLFAFFFTGITYGQTQPLRQQWKKAVVPIEVAAKTEEGNDTLITVGTGFLTRNKRGLGFIVTCKHVVKDLPQAWVKFHVKGQKTMIAVPLGSENFHFVYHPNAGIDLAVSALPNIDGTELDVSAIGLDLFMPSDSLFEGEDVYFLGFPMTIGGEKAIPVCRSGIISMLGESEYTFLIEGYAYPGNSGGPVFLKPSIYNFRTNAIGKITSPYLIGVVTKCVNYCEPAFSKQTGRVRITFEENSGLTFVIPSQYIKELIPE